MCLCYNNTRCHLGSAPEKFRYEKVRLGVTCLYGTGAGTAGLSCAARCGRCDEADVVKPAPRHLDLLHVWLGSQRDDGLELGAANPSHSHRLHGFNILKIKLGGGG